MLFQIAYYIGILSYYVWFVWPFLFVFCLAYGIADLVRGTDKPPIKLVIAALALLVMLCSVWGPLLFPGGI
nr:hypothetical protein [uncultured Agathobaculum sp.]